MFRPPAALLHMLAVEMLVQRSYDVSAVDHDYEKFVGGSRAIRFGPGQASEGMILAGVHTDESVEHGEFVKPVRPPGAVL